MDSRQRILKALNNEIPDRVPTFELLIDEASIIKLAKLLIDESINVTNIKTRFGEESKKSLELHYQLAEKLDLDSLTTFFSTGLNRIDDNIAEDRFGTKFHLSEHGQPLPFEGPIKSLKDTIGFDMVKGLKDEDFEGPRLIIKRTEGKRAVFLLLSDPFKLSWKLRGGMEDLLFDYALEPALVHKLASITTDFNFAAIDYAASMGIDAIAVEGDLAGSENLIMSPDHFKEYVKPYLAKIVEYSHSKGLKIIKHSDGNIWQILDDLVEVGFDGIHPIQPQCMDIGEVKEYLKDKACIIGNIDCQELLPNGSTDEVDRTVKETIDIASPGGGYIISSSNSIHPGVRPENYIAMIEAVHKYGYY
ncbi:uroporphyrinogen decarboxylase family protein [Actinomycetota bacterium]